MKFELNKKNIILILIFIFLVIVFGVVYNLRYPSNNGHTESKTTLLNDYSRFFTVNNSATSYINYIAKKDSDTLLKLLSDSYMEANNINKDNVLEKLGILTGYSYSFQARKIYQESLSSTMIKYYIYGELKEEVINAYIKPTDYYLILIMDTKNLTFSVTPYDGKIFKEAK